MFALSFFALLRLVQIASTRYRPMPEGQDYDHNALAFHSVGTLSSRLMRQFTKLGSPGPAPLRVAF
jgi:hypothetical protein